MDECYNKTGKAPIGTRWVDVNKGDSVHPEYRSWLVAQEINTNRREDLFAPTPPLEAKKMLKSMAVTEGVGFKAGRKQQGMKLDFIDVRRAYFHAKSRREVYVALPAEDWEDGKCGKLLKAMCGTRDAAQNWEYAYVEALEVREERLRHVHSTWRSVVSGWSCMETTSQCWGTRKTWIGSAGRSAKCLR